MKFKHLSLPKEDPISFNPSLYNQWSGGDDIIDRLAENWGYIRTHYHAGRRLVDLYVIRLHWGTNEDIIRSLRRVLYNLTAKCYVNISFSYILQHKLTMEMRVFYASFNSQLFSHMFQIFKRQHITNFLDKVMETDVIAHVSKKMPSSKWKLVRIISMNVKVIKTSNSLL